MILCIIFYTNENEIYKDLTIEELLFCEHARLENDYEFQR